MTERKSISKAMRARVILRQEGRCSTCKERFEVGDKIELDHGHDLWLGGPDDETNLFAKHAECHARHTKAAARDRAHIRRLSGQNKPRVKKRIPAHINGIPSRPFRRLAAQQTGER